MFSTSPVAMSCGLWTNGWNQRYRWWKWASSTDWLCFASWAFSLGMTWESNNQSSTFRKAKWSGLDFLWECQPEAFLSETLWASKVYVLWHTKEIKSPVWSDNDSLTPQRRKDKGLGVFTKKVHCNPKPKKLDGRMWNIKSHNIHAAI